MIKTELCGGCGRTIFTVPVANLTIKTDPEALEVMGAVTALTDGRPLYRVAFVGGIPRRLAGVSRQELGELNRTPADRPFIVREHRCDPAEAAVARQRAVQGGGGTPAPKEPRRPSVARGQASSGPSTALSGVPDVRPTAPIRSEGVQRFFSGLPGPSVTPEISQAYDRPPDESTTPRCDDCGLMMAEGDYVSVQIGEIYVWALHVQNCR